MGRQAEEKEIKVERSAELEFWICMEGGTKWGVQESLGFCLGRLGRGQKLSPRLRIPRGGNKWRNNQWDQIWKFLVCSRLSKSKSQWTFLRWRHSFEHSQNTNGGWSHMSKKILGSWKIKKKGSESQMGSKSSKQLWDGSIGIKCHREVLSFQGRPEKTQSFDLKHEGWVDIY